MNTMTIIAITAPATTGRDGIAMGVIGADIILCGELL